jgi:hypothetical protein
VTAVRRAIVVTHQQDPVAGIEQDDPGGQPQPASADHHDGADYTPACGYRA